MKDLLLKHEAAALLGVSVSTFDRARKRLGLSPVLRIQLKPIVFRREDVEAVAAGGIPQNQPNVVTLPVLRRARRALTK